MPSTGVVALAAAAAAAPPTLAWEAELGVVAAGPSNLIPSFGFHVSSLGKLVPGDVCRAEPDEAEGGGRTDRGVGRDDDGGGGGFRGRFEFEAYVRTGNATAYMLCRRCRCVGMMEVSLLARGAARRSIMASLGNSIVKQPIC